MLLPCLQFLQFVNCGCLKKLLLKFKTAKLIHWPIFILLYNKRIAFMKSKRNCEVMTKEMKRTENEMKVMSYPQHKQVRIT